MFHLIRKSFQIIKCIFSKTEDRVHDQHYIPNKRDSEGDTGAVRDENTYQDANFKNRDINPILFSTETSNDKFARLKTTVSKYAATYFEKGNP